MKSSIFGSRYNDAEYAGLVERVTRIEVDLLTTRYDAIEGKKRDAEQFGKLVARVSAQETRVDFQADDMRAMRRVVERIENAMIAYQRAASDLAALVEKAERFYKSYASLHKRIGEMQRAQRNYDLGMNSLSHMIAGSDRETRLRFDKVADKLGSIEQRLRGVRLDLDGSKKDGV